MLTHKVSVAQASRLVFVSALAASSSLAFAHEGDIAVGVRNGKIVTGLGDDSSGGASFDTRVYGAEFIFDAGNVFTDEPGYLGPFLDGFAPGASLGFNVRSALGAWDGSSFAATALSVTIDNGGSGVTTPATDVLTSGFTLVADASVDFDEHAFFILSGNVPGIYLVELELTSPGLGTSLPFWVVHNYDMSEDDHDAAIDYVVQNIVPAPPAAGLFSLALLAGASRRRR